MEPPSGSKGTLHAHRKSPKNKVSTSPAPTEQLGTYVNTDSWFTLQPYWIRSPGGGIFFSILKKLPGDFYVSDALDQYLGISINFLKKKKKVRIAGMAVLTHVVYKFKQLEENISV